MRPALIAFLLCEVAYVVAVRVLVHHFTGSALQLELYWSGLRLVSIAGLAWIFVRLRSAKAGPAAGISPRSLIALGILTVPLLVGNLRLGSPYRYVFAATSILVGLREELAYRAILQGFLSRRWGFVAGLLISNFAFVCYHFGVQPFTLPNVLQLALVGLILGVVYEFTGSLLLVVVLHSLYDALLAFTPVLARPWPEWVGTIIFSVILAALLLGRKKPSPSPKPVPGDPT